MGQLAFKWPQRPSYAAEDFILSGANEEAFRMLENWPSAGAQGMLLSGPEASGKTHLAACWARRTGAVVMNAAALAKASSQALWGNARHAVLEDIHLITHQTALFHLLRHAEAHGLSLLLTARAPAAQLHFALADLRSRLLAMPAAAIGAPDETLLKGFLFKCFADRQLHAGEEAMDYLVAHMERSFATALALVERLEVAVLASGRDITVPFVKKIMV